MEVQQRACEYLQLLEMDEDIRGVVLVRIPIFEGESVKEKLQIPVGNSQIDEVPINTGKHVDGDDEDDGIIDILGDTPVKKKKQKKKEDDNEMPDLLGDLEGSEEESSDNNKAQEEDHKVEDDGDDDLLGDLLDMGGDDEPEQEQESKQQ